MKILYIAMKYDYGDPKRGFSFEHYNFYDSLTRMNNGENQVIYFPFDEITQKIGKDKMNKRLIETAYQEKPDLCFFFLFENEIRKEIIKKISQRFLTFNWFADDHWRFENFSKYYAPYFHWVATTDSQAVEKYHQIGYKNVIKTQWACNHFLYKPLNDAEKRTQNNAENNLLYPEITYKIKGAIFSNPLNISDNQRYRYEVSFIGQPHGNRRKIIEKLRKVGIEVKC